MKVGLHIADFTWDGGPPVLGPRLGEIARRAEDAGVDRISVMDHVWQIGHLGPPEHEMLEAYTALGFLAGVTERVKLLTVVTAVVYREPGLLAKAVTTLDVLCGGRAILGIGAAWNEEEARGLNSPQALSRPHPPILIGGGGERKTLRLVARYADACNLFDTPELAHKLDVLRAH